MSVLRTSIDSVRAELSSNPRLRLGAWSIVFILLGYSVFVPHAARVDRAAANHAVVDARLARAQELLAREDWQPRLEEARRNQAALNERIWHAGNPGLAQAHVRTAIEGMARGVALLEPGIGVGSSRLVPGVPGLWQVDVQVNSKSGLESALRFVYAVARHPRVLLADRFSLSRRSLIRRDEEFGMEILFSAYFRIDSPDESQDVDQRMPAGATGG